MDGSNNPANVLTRRLHIEGLEDREQGRLLQSVGSLPGVTAVSMPAAGRLCVSYDAMRCNLDQVEAALGRVDCRLATDWWSRTKAGWYRYTETNLRDNANAEAHCCNKPPTGR